MSKRKNIINDLAATFSRKDKKPVVLLENSLKTKKQNLASFTDKPIIDPKEDRFSRSGFAKQIAEVIANRKENNSIVLAIYGGWGEGKTTVLNFVNGYLKNHTDIITIKFNPWRYDDENQLLISFFNKLAVVLGHKKFLRKGKIGKYFRQYAGLLAPIKSADKVIDTIGQIVGSNNIEELKKQINDFLVSANKKIVVFIDDIDCLDKNEINSLFRLIKLTADFDSICYILAFDKDVVTSALRERYSTSTENIGEEFLEKIVQIPLKLPSAKPSELSSLFIEKINQILDFWNVDIEPKDIDRFKQGFDYGISFLLTTPRVIKRYINAINFCLPLLINEVNYADIFLTEGLRIFYPDVYKNIQENPDAYLCFPFEFIMQIGFEEKDYEKTRNGCFSKLSEKKKKVIGYIINNLFPRTGRSKYTDDWDKEWTREKRICSKYYFYRYFSYSIHNDDISDHLITQQLSLIEDNQLIKELSLFSEFVNDQNAYTFIQKIRLIKNELSTLAVSSIAVWIAQNTSNFQDSGEGLSAFTPLDSAARFTYDLVEAVPVDDRGDLFKKIIQCNHSLPFLAIFASRLFFQTANQDSLFSNPSEEKEIRNQIISAISKFARKEPFYLSSVTFRHTPLLFSIWNSFNKEATEEYLLERINKTPSEIYPFIRSYLGVSVELESGIRNKSNFSGDTYNNIANIINSDFVRQILLSLNPDISYNEYVYYGDNEDSYDLVISKQFLFIHDRKSDE